MDNLTAAVDRVWNSLKGVKRPVVAGDRTQGGKEETDDGVVTIRDSLQDWQGGQCWPPQPVKNISEPLNILVKNKANFWNPSISAVKDRKIRYRA